MPISGFHSKWLSWQRWQIRKTFRRSAAAATLVLLQSLQSFKDGGQPQTVVLRVVKEGHTDGGSHAPRRVRISCSLVPCHPCFALANTYIATNTTKSLREINKRKKETTSLCDAATFFSFFSLCLCATPVATVFGTCFLAVLVCKDRSGCTAKALFKCL